MKTNQINLKIVGNRIKKLSGKPPIKYSSDDFKSQHGQDRYIYQKYFQNIINGTFVEFGAWDGLNLSNTWFFEQKLN